MTELPLIVISIVVACALLRNEFGVEDVSAVSGPVFDAKNIVVDNFAVNNDERVGVEKLIFQWGGEDYGFGLLSAMLNAFKALHNFAGWENRTCSDSIICVA